MKRLKKCINVTTTLIFTMRYTWIYIPIIKNDSRLPGSHNHLIYLNPNFN
jgi:hypothetical protein